jgi:hypothetical protein
MYNPISLYPGFDVIIDGEWTKIRYNNQKIFRFNNKNTHLFHMESNRCFSFDFPDAEGVVKNRVVYYINDLGYVKQCEETLHNGVWSITSDKRVGIKAK